MLQMRACAASLEESLESPNRQTSFFQHGSFSKRYPAIERFRSGYLWNYPHSSSRWRLPSNHFEASIGVVVIGASVDINWRSQQMWRIKQLEASNQNKRQRSSSQTGIRKCIHYLGILESPRSFGDPRHIDLRHLDQVYASRKPATCLGMNLTSCILQPVSYSKILRYVIFAGGDLSGRNDWRSLLIRSYCTKPFPFQ
jgi:hypothetical protein